MATSESVVLMPHLARIDVMPAKNAEANAAAIQDKRRLRSIERRHSVRWVGRRCVDAVEPVQYSARACRALPSISKLSNGKVRISKLS